MTPGLDPSLFEEADDYRRAASKPKPHVDGAELQRHATTEARALLKDAARVLSRAGIPTLTYYTRARFRLNKTDAWDLYDFVLTKSGTAHRRTSRGPDEITFLDDELEVGLPRSIVGDVPMQVLSATDDGRAEIFYNTYDYDWMLLADWLNEKLRHTLRS